jgi:hypothetical protein
MSQHRVSSRFRLSVHRLTRTRAALEDPRHAFLDTPPAPQIAHAFRRVSAVDSSARGADGNDVTSVRRIRSGAARIKRRAAASQFISGGYN